MATKKKMAKCWVDYPWTHLVDVRIMAEAEGWSLVRQKGAMPMVVRTKELLPPETTIESIKKAMK